MGKEIELNVVLLPPPQIRDMAIDMSRKVRESLPTDFVLDGETSQPHVTVYQARVPEKNMGVLRANLRAVAAKVSPFEVSLGKTSSWKDFVWWDAEPSREFDHLSKSVIYQLNPLREGLVLGGLEEGIKNRKFDMSQTYSIQRYGSIVHPPHVTITHTPSERGAREALSVLNPRVAKFTAREIHLGLLGKFGTVTELLDTFPFAGQHSPYIL